MACADRAADCMSIYVICMTQTVIYMTFAQHAALLCPGKSPIPAPRLSHAGIMLTSVRMRTIQRLRGTTRPAVRELVGWALNATQAALPGS